MSRIVVIGDVLLDVDADGSATRLVPDEPAPVVDVGHRWLRPGGAGLAAALLATRSTSGSGAEVTLVAAFGDDDSGHRLIDLLASDLRVRRLPLDGSTPTKTRIRVSGRTIARLDDGNGRARQLPLPRDVAGTILDADAVLVSDYGRGLAAHPGIRSLLADRIGQIPIIWDPHPRGPDPVPGCSLITPNLAEACGYAARHAADHDHNGPDADHDHGAGAVARDLVRHWEAGAVAVTAGDQGAVVAIGAADPVSVPVPSEIAPADQAVDTCGAGDRFAGAVTAELADGADVLRAVRAGVRDASRFVATGGATALNTESNPQHNGGQNGGQISGQVSGPNAISPAGRLTAFELAERVRRRGGRVVATGGCFDLLHPGHLELLHRARDLGDALVVCVNSDDSVRRLKGPSRPINPARDRVRMLLELGPVDAAVVFDESDPTTVLARLRPDIWVKGDDYAGREIAEAAVVRRYGGDVVFLPTVDGYSTTRLLQEVTARCWF